MNEQIKIARKNNRTYIVRHAANLFSIDTLAECAIEKDKKSSKLYNGSESQFTIFTLIDRTTVLLKYLLQSKENNHSDIIKIRSLTTSHVFLSRSEVTLFLYKNMDCTSALTQTVSTIIKKK